MKSIFRIYPLWTKTIGLLTLAVGATPTCQAGSEDISSRRTGHFNPFAILLLSLVCNFGGSLNTLLAQQSGWNRWVDPRENAFAMEVPQGWHVHGGAYRFGYGDVRVMVDAWSPDGKINVRYGDVWFVESYAVPDRYHREGEQQDLGALGKGRYAAYRTGQQFAEIYARGSFGGVCRSLTPQRTGSPAVSDTSGRRQRGGAVSSGEVTFRCETPQGTRIAYATARTTLTTSQPIAYAPPTRGWTPELASYLAPPDRVADAVSILRHFVASFKVNPRWRQYQSEMDRKGTAYAVARAQGRISQQQQQFASFSQRMNAQVSQFQAGQSRQQAQVDNFDLALNGQVRTNDPTHPTVDQGLHHGKWNCGTYILDSDLGRPGCVPIN